MESESSIKPKSIGVNYILNLVYEIFALLTPLITTPYVSRVLGAEGVGIYSYTNSIAQYFILFGNLGVATYGQMQIAKFREDKREVSKIFYELWILRAVTMSISLAIYLAASMLSEEYRSTRLVLGILIFASIFDITWLFRGIEDFTKVVLRNFVVKIAMIIMIFMLVKSPDDVGIYVFLISLSTLLGNFSFLFSIKNILCKVPIRSLEIRRHVKECFVFFIPTIATSVYTILDKTMLGLLTDGTAENGYYEQAHRVEQILIVIITSLNTIMRSRMSLLYKQKRYSEMHSRLDNSIQFILLISCAMTAGLIGIADTFIPLFLGDGFEESIGLLKIFAFLLIIIGLSNCLNTHFLGPSGRQGKNNYILIFGALVNFIFNYYSIPILGATGAAISSVLAETLILLGYLYLSRDFFKAGSIFKFGWRYFLAGIIMEVCVSYLGKIPINSIAVLLLQIVSGVFLYLIMLFALRDGFFLSITDRIINLIKKGVNR